MTNHPSPTLFMVPRQRLPELSWEPFVGSVGVEHKVLYESADTVAGLLRLHPGAHEISHLHLHGEHHVWVLGGSVCIDDTHLDADSYLHVPAGLWHTVEDDGSGSLLFYVFCPATG